MDDTLHLVRSALLNVAHTRRLKHRKGAVRLFFAEESLRNAVAQLERFQELNQGGEMAEQETE